MLRTSRGLTDPESDFIAFARETEISEGRRAQVDTKRRQIASLSRYEEYGIRRTLYGFYYISHYYPLRAMAPVSPAEALSTIESLAGSSFEIYVHYPFCEQLCGFCHFHKEIDTPSGIASREGEVVDFLIAELQLNRRLLGGPIPSRSLQFGGGTPSMLSTSELSRLLRACEQNLALSTGAEIKTEIYPKRHEPHELRERLRILKAFGFTDLVIDLESGNKPSLDAVNRRNSSLEAYLEIIELAMSEGFDSFITALMPGLPYETHDTFLSTLETLVEVPELKVINLFPTIIRETDPIGLRLSRSSTGFNTAIERDVMWALGRDFLRDRGFVEGPISYLHRSNYRPEQQAEKFECVNLLGFGASSFGYLNGDGWGGQYFNQCEPGAYRAAIAAGHPAIWRFGKYDNSERARRKVMFGLANVQVENLVRIEEMYGVSVDDIYGRELNALEELGLIEVVPEARGIRYTEDGLLRLEEITYFLYSDRVKDSCDTLPSRDDPNYRWLINQHYAPTIPRTDRERFERFAAIQSPQFMHKLGPANRKS